MHFHGIHSARMDGVPGAGEAMPGEAFTYTSGCPLGTPFGKMEGTYQMVSRSGDFFDVAIAPFTLSEPYTVH